ncbi:MAG: energy transducer TonB [Bryobacteraceae bacterium]|nr:energy transducer TonB [Bryobacteraceae bacterium]
MALRLLAIALVAGAVLLAQGDAVGIHGVVSDASGGRAGVAGFPHRGGHGGAAALDRAHGCGGRVSLAGRAHGQLHGAGGAGGLPRDCKAERVEGTVLLRVSISREGTVLDLQPVNQFVDSRLREAAAVAVKQWRYRPTLLNGEAVEVATEVEVNFTLLP